MKECVAKEQDVKALELDSCIHLEPHLYFDSFSKITNQVFKKKK